MASALSQLPKEEKSGPVLGLVVSFGRQLIVGVLKRLARMGRGVAFCLLVAVVVGQPIDPAEVLPEKYSPKLDDLLGRALQQSPSMLLKNIELAKADADAEVARGVRYPNLGGSARYGVEGVSTTNSPSSTNQGFFYNMGLTQPVFHWGSIQASIKLGELQVKIAERQYADAYRELVHSVRSQYLALMLKKRMLAKRRYNLELFEQNFLAEKERFMQGQLAPAPFADLEMALEEARIGVAKEALEYDAAKSALLRMVGLPGLGDADVVDEIPRPGWKAGYAEKWVQQMLQKIDPGATPGAQVYTYLIRQSELKYTQAKARLLPKVEVSAGRSLENQTYLSTDRVEQNATTRNTANISATWTLFDGFATRGAKRQALAERRQNERHLQTYLETIADKRRFAIQQAELAGRVLELAEKRLAAQKATVPYAEIEAKAGRVSAAQLAQTKAALLEVEQRTLECRVDLYLRWSELVSLMWGDPQLHRVPERYMAQDRSVGRNLGNYWPW